MKLLHAVVLASVAGLARAQDPALDPADAGPAQRIWCADMQEQQQVWMRRRFQLPAKVTTARLVFSCDNECTVLVNGVEVASCDNWEELTVVDLEQLKRDNVIAVEAENTGGPAALACWLLWTDPDGTEQQLVSDAQWRVATAPADGWAKPEFDDTKWPAATANFTSTFGLNCYNGKPARIHFRNRFTVTSEAIEKALQDLRKARDRAAALEALDAIERAVMAARAEVWAKPKARSEDKR